MLKKIITQLLEQVSPGDISVSVTIPEQEAQGHYSTNLAMVRAKREGKEPVALAEELMHAIKSRVPRDFFEKIEVAPPGFINFWVSAQAQRDAFRDFRTDKKFGAKDVGRGKKVIVEYSSPNIAKPMHVGHLRSTIIGDALANIHEFLGYTVIRWNYLGDWGTQFGKLIAAYKMWGKEKEVKEAPIDALVLLYVRFHGEEEKDPALLRRGQEEFRKLEHGDAENRKLWEWFRRESVREFGETYEKLGVTFDVVSGESDYEKDLPAIVAELLKKGIAKESEGAVIIPLDEFHLPPALIRKSDEASVYFTRELAVLKLRLEKYAPEKILYVVANQQALHFSQLAAAAKLLGWDAEKIAHVKFGLVLGEDKKKLSTREGKTIPLDELVNKAVSLARKIVEEKNPELPEKEKAEIAEMTGIGALKYNDLKEHRSTDIVFDWGKMLSVRGNSAPYLQYSHARIRSIGRKAGKIGAPDFSTLETDEELSLIRHLFELPYALERAVETYATNGLAEYLFKLANLVNGYYESTPILKDENVPRKNARLSLLRAAAEVLSKGLGLLGIKAPERM
ncbi:MAG: arginine--tRNA ligase [Candidatus Liptonbacteria bacterium]|nr:arginine--tRNA ligase [Candidatus Liptonbacteria bacterium]